MSHSNNPLRQEGGLPDLGLADIDQRLDWPNKSVEKISDPMARLVVLWTLIGQYEHAAILADSENDGEFTVQNAQRFQLLSAWSHETRRVMPRHRLEAKESQLTKKVLRLIESDKPLGAYSEVIDMRDWMPEYMHPDVRFDLLYAIWSKSKPLNGQDCFRDIVLRDMVSETMPGGMGYCDNVERLRRYDMLSNTDGHYARLIDMFIDRSMHGMPPEDTGFFDNTTTAIGDVCDLIAQRRYSSLGSRVLDMGVVGMTDELTLLSSLEK